MTADLGYPDIGELVPHMPPMLAIEEVLDWREGYLRGRMTIREDSPFATDGVVEGVVALEYMAQAVAACLGMDSYRKGTNVRVGMVVACRQLTLAEPTLQVGAEYSLEAECAQGSDHTSLYRTTMTRASGEPVATAMMTLVHGDAPPPD